MTESLPYCVLCGHVPDAHLRETGCTGSHGHCRCSLWPSQLDEVGQRVTASAEEERYAVISFLERRLELVSLEPTTVNNHFVAAAVVEELDGLVLDLTKGTHRSYGTVASLPLREALGRAVHRMHRAGAKRQVAWQPPAWAALTDEQRACYEDQGEAAVHTYLAQPARKRRRG